MKFFLLFLSLCVSIAGFSVAFANESESVSESSEMAFEVVNINSADANTLAQTLTGVGVKRAQQIVAWRETHGPFTAVEQLLNIKGIGEATLAKNKSRIQL